MHALVFDQTNHSLGFSAQQPKALFKPLGNDLVVYSFSACNRCWFRDGVKPMPHACVSVLDTKFPEVDFSRLWWMLRVHSHGKARYHVNIE